MNEQEQLKSQDIEVRAAAAEALSLMGPDAAFASVELVKSCADDESVSQWAVAALEELGAPPGDSLEKLTGLASSDHPLVAYWAITLLGRSGNAAMASEERLTAILQESKNLSVQQRAAWALGEINAASDGAIAALESAARSPDARLSRIAATSLKKSRT